MTEALNIQYLHAKEIDKHKWDACINKASNGLIYGYSFYLDHMASQWDGLILGDYEMVMPLPWKRKYGIFYIYQPFLTAQLGIFGNDISTVITKRFIDAIPEKFKLVEISLNPNNIFDTETISLRANYILQLNSSYDNIYGNYRDNIKRNIKKAIQLGCNIVKGFEADKVIDLALQQMRSYDTVVKENVIQFRKLYNFLEKSNKAITYGVELNNRLIASCIFFFSHNRAYYILVGNHPDGKTIGASHMLIDAFIKDYSDQHMLLDFEGSDIRNLAFFYSSFGASMENYAFLKMNRLPAYLKWLKK